MAAKKAFLTAFGSAAMMDRMKVYSLVSKKVAWMAALTVVEMGADEQVVRRGERTADEMAFCQVALMAASSAHVTVAW